MIYALALSLHNLTRWAVVVLGLWVLIRVIHGLVTRRAWVNADRLAFRWFALAFSIQLLFGAILFFYPNGLVNGVINNVALGEVMRTRLYRFFVVEHPTTMLIALALSHVASVATRRQASAGRDRRAFVIGLALIALTLVLVFVSIPWPFLPWGRPLLRLG
jgi:hypothetical protein